MSKKDKKELSEGDVQTVLAMIPTLERLLETYKEAAKVRVWWWRSQVGMNCMLEL